LDFVAVAVFWLLPAVAIRLITKTNAATIWVVPDFCKAISVSNRLREGSANSFQRSP